MNSERDRSTNSQTSGLSLFRHRWIYDWASPWEYTAHAVKREIFHRQSSFQEISIVETEGYGRCLLLDGEVQSFEADEHIYHESLVHPALLLHSAPRRVLVIGGGEGATLREVLRHRSVELATMVDIDQELISAAREFLPSFHQGAFDDPRARLVYRDGRSYVSEYNERFHAVLVDVTNPMEGGPSYRLFTTEFYRALAERLEPGGVVAIQSDAVTLHSLESAATIHHTARSVWPHVFTYAVFLPAFNCDWSFTLGCGQPMEPLKLNVGEIDRALGQRLYSSLRFYDGIAHQRLFHLPKYFRDTVAAHSRISRDQQPLTQTFPGFTRD